MFELLFLSPLLVGTVLAIYGLLVLTRFFFEKDKKRPVLQSLVWFILAALMWVLGLEIAARNSLPDPFTLSYAEEEEVTLILPKDFAFEYVILKISEDSVVGYEQENQSAVVCSIILPEAMKGTKTLDLRKTESGYAIYVPDDSLEPSMAGSWMIPPSKVVVKYFP